MAGFWNCETVWFSLAKKPYSAISYKCSISLPTWPQEMKLDSLLKAEKGLDTVFTKLLTSGSHL